jgi:hypothetical protein
LPAAKPRTWQKSTPRPSHQALLVVKLRLSAPTLTLATAGAAKPPGDSSRLLLLPHATSGSPPAVVGVTTIL